MKPYLLAIASAFLMVLSGCEKTEFATDEDVESPLLSSSDVAKMLSSLPIAVDQMREVLDAVEASSGNGYDEEYTMSGLFSAPGLGVGDAAATKGSSKEYELPMRDLIESWARSERTKAEGEEDVSMTADEYLAALKESGYQIYWPYHDSWDGSSLPIVTFDPGDNSYSNEGYRIVQGTDGSRMIDTVTVTEEMAATTPVWVVNSNSDASYTSLELLRRSDPSWGDGGGDIVVGGASDTKAIISSSSKLRTLILKTFTAKRNYDTWLAGGSEFFVKCGSLENFTASTEEELRNYVPSITDFMIVVKRSQVGAEVPFNAVLVSEWSDQLEKCAFMIHEDDGGTQTSWKCSGSVKIKSKSYGFDMEIPLNIRDDIVWRGSLSHSYIERYDEQVGHFGDVDIVFSIVEN